MPYDAVPQSLSGRGQSRFDFNEHFRFGRGLDNLDAAQNVFFQRELEHIIPEMFEKEFALINARRIFPIDRSAGGAVKSITWRQFNKFGQAQIIADYGDDINLVNVDGEEFTTPVRGLAVGAQWNIQEIREAQRENRPLDRMYSDAARETMLRTENASTFSGDAAFGLQGLASAGTGIPQAAVPTGAWLTPATAADDILSDLNFVPNTIVETTGDVEIPDTMIMPTRHYNVISNRPRSTTSDTTILQFFLKNNPFINEVIPVREMDTAFGGTGPVCMAYKRDPSKIRMQVPMDIEQFAPQESGMTVRVIWHMRIGGLTVHKPGSLLIGTGIGA